MATTDDELLKRARKYDDQAIVEIYDRYAPAIYRYLYRYLGSAALAEDLTSEVFLKLLHALDKPRAPRQQLQGWLYRVAHNLAMDWFRKQAKGATLPLVETLAAENDSPPAVLEKLQSQQQLRAAIRQLTRDQQQMLILRFGEGLKLAEVARLMEKSEGAVKTLQHRALTRLRKLLT